MSAGDRMREAERVVITVSGDQRCVEREKLLDRRVIVRPRESIECTRRLTDVGLFAGLSSGAVMAGAFKCARTIEDGTTATIVTMIATGGTAWHTARSKAAST